VFKLRNPASMLPEFNVVTIYHFLRSLSRGVVILAVQVDGFDDIAVLANKIGLIMRHGRNSLGWAGALPNSLSPKTAENGAAIGQPASTQF
jgi:hypothetical protein